MVAPKGKRNGQYRHGLYTIAVTEERRTLSASSANRVNLSMLFQVRID
jgi:hypothetical protein